MRSSGAVHTSSGVLPVRSAGNSTPDISASSNKSEFSYHYNSNHVNPKRNSRSRRRSIVVANETGSNGSASNPRLNRSRQGQGQAFGTSKVTSKGNKNKDTHGSQISTKVPSSTRVPHSNSYRTKEPKSYKTPKALKKEKQVHFHAKRATNSGRHSFGKGEGKISSSIAMYQVREHFEKCEQLCRKRRRPRGHGNGKGRGVSPFLATGKMEKDKYHGSSRDFIADDLDTKVLAVVTKRTGQHAGNALPKEFEDKDVSSGSYRSMGGKGGKDYSNRTHGNAKVPRDGSNGDCCIGGVSFLKFRLHGIGMEMERGNGSTEGALTVGSHRSSARYSSTNATGKGHNKVVKTATGKGSTSAMQGDSSQSVIFVDCENPCLNAPVLESANCRITSTNATNNRDVKEGDEVCLAVWNSKTREIEMSSSLPKVVLLTLGSMKTKISTSCASPIYPPYAQYFTLHSDDNDDENVWIPFHNEEDEELDLKPKIVYLDGFSPSWVYFSQNMAEFHNDVYDYSFAACGCACGDTNTSSSIPSDVPQTESTPSQTPTIDREVPTVISSLQPSPSELGLQILIPTKSPSSQSAICLETCKSWIESNCVLLVDGNGKCSQTSAGGRLLSSKSVGSKSSSREELVHHKKLVAAMRALSQYLY